MENTVEEFPGRRSDGTAAEVRGTNTCLHWMKVKHQLDDTKAHRMKKCRMQLLLIFLQTYCGLWHLKQQVPEEEEC